MKKQYGPIWRRMVAFLIDTLLLFIPISLVAKGLYLMYSVPEGDALKVLISNVYLILSTIPAIIYAAWMESSTWQATVGKKLMNLQVEKVDGTKLSFGRAFARQWLKWLSFYPAMIGIFIASIHKKKQTLHDILMKSVVVKKEEKK